MKPELEFFDVQTLAALPFAPNDPSIKSSKRSLSIDPETGDETCVLYHPPGDEWGWKEESVNGYAGGTHVYWEEVYILKGQLWDGNTEKWYKGACRDYRLRVRELN